MEGSTVTQPACGDHRLTAEEMDSQRQQSVAYEYLCRLEEAKRWMEAVLGEPLPPTTELEESLRHGVHLARLALRLRPDGARRVYDPDLARYAARGLQFRHTDNINLWTQTMRDMGLPQTFIPTTTDVYEKKNMPKVIYCIHALSLFAFKLGRAPQMLDLLGKAVFTEAEIDAMSAELRKYGLSLPTFGKIGGILASEMPVDKAALHAAVIVINEAVDRQVPAETLAGLQNLHAHLRDVSAENAHLYQERLWDAKRAKVEAAQNRSLSETFEADVYDELLTQAEIQGHVAAANRSAALGRLHSAVSAADSGRLLAALCSPALGLQGVSPDGAAGYLDGLRRATNGHPLSAEEVQTVISRVNQLSSQRHREEELVAAVNACLAAPDASAGRLLALLDQLRPPDAGALPHWAAPLFLREMAAVRQEQAADLSVAAVRGALGLLPAVARVNAALAAGEPAGLWRALADPAVYILDLDESCSRRYLSALTAVSRAVRAETPDCPFVTHALLQRTVDDVNADVQEEQDKVELIERVNRAVLAEDDGALLTALTNPILGYSSVSEHNVRHCLQLLQEVQQEQDGGDGDGLLWLEHVDQAVRNALVDHELAERACAALCELNGPAPAGGLSAGRLVALLSLPCLGLHDVSPGLAEHYLAALRRHRAAGQHTQGSADTWVRHSVGGAVEAYLDLSGGRVSWQPPDGHQMGGHWLDQTTLQELVTEAALGEAGRQCPERWLVPLQAAARGLLLRRRLLQRRLFLSRHTDQIVRIQAWWRGVRQRRRFLLQRAARMKERVDQLRREVDELRERREWEEGVLARYRPHEELVVRLQRWWRRHHLRQEFQQLAGRASPSVPLLRKFVHLLDVRGADFKEEVQLQKLKADVAQMIRKNQMLERDLDTLDVKIGLLVRNRISLQEVLMHSKSMDATNKTGTLPNKLGTMSRGQGLKALSRESRARLSLYQQLFYELQTRPEYLARLVFALPPGQSGRFLESVVPSVFNYGANDRDEFLLVKLFRIALQEEVRSRVDRLSDVVTGNPMVVRLIVQYSRRHPLRPVLGPLVERVLTDRSLLINTSPVEIYRHWVNQQEAQTGQPCGLPYSVTQEEALQHPEVSRRLSRAIHCLKEASNIFLDEIFNAVDQLPYCLLYSARVLRQALHDKFPEAPEKDVLKVVGNLVYYRYINSAIVAPDAFDIVSLPADQAMTPDQRRNLGSIAKILQFAASKKGFGDEAGHLQALNPFIVSAHERFKEFVRACCAVPEPEQHYGRNEFTEATLMARPVVYVSAQELCDTHRLLLEHEAAVAPARDDPLHQLLEELGDRPSLEGVLGADEAGHPHPERVEVRLELHPRAETIDDHGMSADRVFVQAKQLLVDVMRCTEDADVAACARCEPTELMERAYRAVLQQRGAAERRRHGHQLLSRSGSFLAQPCASLEEAKDALLERLRLLEGAGRAHRADDYRPLREAVAADIVHQRRHRQQRRHELVKLRRTADSLEKKRAFYQEQAAYFSQYLNTCLQAMAAGQRTKRAAAPRRYSAARLKEKGVLISIEGMQPAELKGVQFEISPLAAESTFQVNAKLLGVQLERVEISLQELLQLQYDGVSVMDMFGRVRINVNLLIFLLNSKFYGKTKK
ncbi:ras GTPase-activating-like protein IQGAP1 [Amphibalanus amphitrite]|uniref:ras GTPase-activating-like protein IQGAP1 n=1 Tax=Amphibalanus amphitrite TaxID=1232801 RepID=UPI001C914311|nr:ras GTPase-activating-like protein IQGAP1 [Amphibalanus amphitrite]